MITRIIKRDGRKVVFSQRRIQESISAALKDSGESAYGRMAQIVQAIVDAIDVKFDSRETPGVEQIQDVIVQILKEMDLKDTAQAFVDYREDRTTYREIKSDVMKAIDKIGQETVRDNANVGNNFSAKLLQIASVANKYYNLANMPKEHAKMHETGGTHIHDLDSFNLTTNCLQIDLEDKLKKGFNTGYGTILPAQRVSSAADIACIILQASQNDMFGGQGFPDFDNAFSDLVKMSRKEWLYLVKPVNPFLTDSHAEQIAEDLLIKELHQAMQAVVYNLNTMHSRAGSQVPFSSINLGIPRDKDAALICEIFLKEYDKGLGRGEQPIFPNIIFRIKKGVNAYPGDPYYYLRLLAEKVAANRMNPTFRLLDSSLCLPYYKKGVVLATMGCRTDISSNLHGDEGPMGRGNGAPISMNLVRVGIEAKKDWDRFYKNLGKLMDHCAEELMYRYNVLAKLKIKDLPFSAGQGLMKGAEGLSPEDSIEPILKNCTWGIGFIGLAETMVAMTGQHHGQNELRWGEAYAIVKFMADKINEYRIKYNQNFSLYATPAEGLSGRFTKIDQKKYGIIPRVTDKEYYTNSFHIPVGYSISAIDKIEAEAPFHKLCTAGHISYIELDGGDVDSRATFIHRALDYTIDNTDASYVAFNFHIRYCKECGYRIESSSSECPECGSTHIQGVSRVTGYMSLDERFTPGKVAERADRKKHEF